MNEPYPLAPVRPAYAPPKPPAPSAIDLKKAARDVTPALLDMWRAVNERKWWILGAAAVIGVIALAASMLLTPQYRSTALIIFESGGRGRVVSIEEVYSGLGSSNRESSTNQLEFLKSRDVSMRVIRKLGLINHPDFDPTKPGLLAPVGNALRAIGLLGERPPRDVEQIESIVFDRFQQRLQVEPVRLSQLVRVSFESSDRQLAAQVANEIAAAYIQADLDARFAVTEQANTWLNSRLAFLQGKLDRAESDLQKYREEQGLVDNRSGSQGGAGRQLDELNQRLVEARVRRTMAEQAYNQVRPGATDLGQVPAVINHPAVQRTRAAEIEAQRRFNDVAARFGPAHPSYRTAELELRDAREAAAREIESVAASIRKEYEAARAAELSIESTLAGARVSVQGINRKEIRQSALEREVEVNRQLYNLFLARQRETTAAANFQGSSARVIDPAVPALQPFAPNRPGIALAAMMATLLAGALFVVVRHRLDDTLRRADDLEEQVGQPLMAAVPNLPEAQTMYAARMALVSPNSPYAESIRSIASAVQLMSLDTPRRVVLVTSAVPGEGKSTIASNLALIQARLGRTVLVEADLRRPITAARLGLPDDLPGLTDFVSGSKPLVDCIHPIPDSALWVMPCGRPGLNAAELFATDAFATALRALASQFDQVIIDSAPVRPVSDAQLLATHVTGVVFVAAAQSTPAPLVRWALKKLTDSGARIFGVVLNRYDAQRAEKYYGDYGSYSDYAGVAEPLRNPGQA